MSGYIDFPLVTSENELATEALEFLTEAIPGWVPREGHLEVWMIEVWARMLSENRIVAAQVPREIFRYFGQTLLGVETNEAAAATVLTQWTMVDNAGYTVPLGTVVGFRVAGDELIPFETVDDFTVPPGSTVASDVPVQAVEEGAESTGLGPAGLELIDSLSFVDSVAASAATSGGVDAESEQAYLDRLAAELRLLTPRPILPQDFAVIARRVPQVARAVGVDLYDPGVDEAQEVSVADATGGTFTLTFTAQTTGTIAHDATAATVQTALEALSNIDPGDVVVTGGALGAAPVVVTFTGQYAKTNVAQMTADGALLTGTTPTVTVATTQEGSAPSSNNERTVSVAVIDVVGLALDTGVKDEVQALLGAEREVNFVVHIIDPTYTTVNAVTEFTVLPNFEDADVIASVTLALEQYLSPASWAGGEETPPAWRAESGVVRYLEVASLINSIPGVDYVTVLTVNAGTADVALSGVAPLPQPGTVTATVAAP